MSLTGFVRHFFQPRQKELERHINEGPALQREVLETLISEAQDTLNMVGNVCFLI